MLLLLSSSVPPNEIQDWTDDGDTALCPKCGIDSVIGSVSGYPICKGLISPVMREGNFRCRVL